MRKIVFVIEVALKEVLKHHFFKIAFNYDRQLLA